MTYFDHLFCNSEITLTGMESFLSGTPVAPEPVDPRGETVPNPPVKSMDELFDRVAEDIVDGAKFEETPSKSQKKEEKTPTAPSGEIDISKLDIRVGVITKAWEHPEADTLFCEEIDIGEDRGPRQIASGLRAHYNVDDLVGQRVLVLANLKARKLVGFPSHGMVMCASNEDGSKVQFVEPPESTTVGERIVVEGFEGEPVRFLCITVAELSLVFRRLYHANAYLNGFISPLGNGESSDKEKDAGCHLSRSQDQWRWCSNV